MSDDEHPIDLSDPAVFARELRRARGLPIVESAAAPIQDRPRPTVKQVASFAREVTTGKYVEPEVLEARMKICAACEHVRVDGKGNWCSICGCGVSNEDRKVNNLAAYEERVQITKGGKRIVQSGCKHPHREQGKGWPV